MIQPLLLRRAVCDPFPPYWTKQKRIALSRYRVYLGAIERVRVLQPGSVIPLILTIVLPDTPPPSSPSASEQSYAHPLPSVHADRSHAPSAYRLKMHKHRRNSSQLSRLSTLPQPIKEEDIGTLRANSETGPLIPAKSDLQDVPHIVHRLPAVEISHAAYEADGEMAKSISPLFIRKQSSRKRLTIEKKVSSLFADDKTLPMKHIKPPPSYQTMRDPVIIQEDCDYEDILLQKEIRLARFCREAMAELQKR